MVTRNNSITPKPKTPVVEPIEPTEPVLPPVEPPVEPIITATEPLEGESELISSLRSLYPRMFDATSSYGFTEEEMTDGFEILRSCFGHT